MKLRLLLIAVTVLFAAAACGPEPQLRSDRLLQDDSFISEEPCGPPCWRGITPGETSWNEAVAIIEDDATLSEFQSREDEESDRVGAAWAQADGDGCCQMFSEDGESVEFIVMQTTPEVTFAAVIEKHGDPDYVFGESVTDDQGLFSLFYMDVPMVIYAFVEGEAGALSASSEIVGFAYTTPDLMQFLFETSELHAWEGYQSYSAYMDGELEITPAMTLTPDPDA